MHPNSRYVSENRHTSSSSDAALNPHLIECNVNKNISNGANDLILTSGKTIAKAVQLYNRRNNPDLEKRRTHHCDFIGKFLSKMVVER